MEVSVNGDVIALSGVGASNVMTNANVVAADILGSTGILHRVDGIIHNTPLLLAIATPDPALPATTISPTMPTTADQSDLSYKSGVVVSNDTEIVVDENLVSTATMSPSGVSLQETATMGPSDVLAEETASPTVLGSLEGTMIEVESEAPMYTNGTMLEETASPSVSGSLGVAMVEDETEAPVNINKTVFVDSIETLSPSTMFWNETNETAIPAEFDDEESTMSPKILIDTASPTSAPSTSLPTDNTATNGESVAVGNTSNARDLGTILSGVTLFLSTTLLLAC